MPIIFHTFDFLIFTFDFFFTTENTEIHRKIISRKERNVSIFILFANVAGVARNIISRKERYERYVFLFIFLAKVAGVARKTRKKDKR